MQLSYNGWIQIYVLTYCEYTFNSIKYCSMTAEINDDGYQKENSLLSITRKATMTIARYITQMKSSQKPSVTPLAK